MKHSSQNVWRWSLPVALFAAGCLAAGSLAQTSRAQETQATQQVEVGRHSEGQLAGGQSHEYRFTLAAGQYARLAVVQHTINVALAVVAPDGMEVLAIDAYEIGWFEPIEFIADTTGTYRLRVTPTERKAPN